MTHYTYRQAAHRVGRSIRTIKRWRRAGMPMTFDNAGMRVVEERVLLAWWRDRLNAWPTHQWRMRKLARDVHHVDTMEAAPDQVVEHLTGPDPQIE